MTAVSLTPAQRAILEHALRHAEGRINWFPPTINGGARLKVLAGLAKRGLAKPVRKQWTVTDAGRAALGNDGALVAADPAMEAGVTSANENFATSAAPRNNIQSRWCCRVWVYQRSFWKICRESNTWMGLRLGSAS